MKKILPIMIVLILILSGFGAGAISKDVTYDAKNEKKSDESTISFSPPIIEEHDGDYLEVRLMDVSTYLMNPGQPMVPKVVKNVELAFGVKNVKVDVIPKTVKEYEITKEIRPAPAPVPLTEEKYNVVVKSEKMWRYIQAGNSFHLLGIDMILAVGSMLLMNESRMWLYISFQ